MLQQNNKEKGNQMFKSLIFSVVFMLFGIGLTILGWRDIQVNCQRDNNQVNCIIQEYFLNGIYVDTRLASQVEQAVVSRSTVNREKFKNNRKAIYTASLMTIDENVPLSLISTSNKEDAFVGKLVKDINTYLVKTETAQFSGKSDMFSSSLTWLGLIIGFLGLIGIIKSIFGLGKD